MDYFVQGVLLILKSTSDNFLKKSIPAVPFPLYANVASILDKSFAWKSLHARAPSLGLDKGNIFL